MSENSNPYEEDVEVGNVEEPEQFSEQDIEAPDTLTDDELAIWNATISGLKPGWIGKESIAQLEEYCRIKAQLDVLNPKLTDALANSDFSDVLQLKQLKNMLGMIGPMRTQMNAFARSLRITNQANNSGKGSNKPTQVKMPE